MKFLSWVFFVTDGYLYIMEGRKDKSDCVHVYSLRKHSLTGMQQRPQRNGRLSVLQEKIMLLETNTNSQTTQLYPGPRTLGRLKSALEAQDQTIHERMANTTEPSSCIFFMARYHGAHWPVKVEGGKREMGTPFTKESWSCPPPLLR